MRWRSSPMMRNPASRRSPPRLPTFRPSPASTRPSRATTSISGHGQFAGRDRPPYRPGSRSRQGSPSQPRIHRISPASRRRLSGPYGDQADPRQCIPRTSPRRQRRGSPISRRAVSNSPSPAKHGSWLNLVEGFFSKLARSVLRHIRVASKQELKHRIMAAMDEFNRRSVVHTWSYRLDLAA